MSATQTEDGIVGMSGNRTSSRGKGGAQPTRIPEEPKLTTGQKKDLQALSELPDDRIDTTDVPEVPDWSGARRGVFYRPVKQQITLRLDAEIVAWFKTHAQGGRGYQTDINQVLREHIQRRERGRTVAKQTR